MRHAGLLAHSPDGAALCFKEFCHEGALRLGGHIHPDITLDYIAFGHSLAAWDKGDHAVVRATLARSIARLADAGAQFFFCPDNTAHIALETPGDSLPLPGLHIAEIVADRAVASGHRNVGVLGTAYTMDGPVYRRAFGAREIDCVIADAADRDSVNRIIFEELVAGILAEQSHRTMLAVIDRLKDEGCDAVALACTEIPLLVTEDASSLPILDSTRLLASAALDVALGDAPMPDWRGGPLP